MFQKTPRDYFIIQVQYYKFWTSLLAQIVKSLSTIQETWVRSLGWEDKEMATHSSTLA